MKNPWIRLLIAAISAEALPIMLLIALVALLGPGNAAEDQAYAAKLGAWVGPLGGAIATFFLAIWVARPFLRGQVVYGTLLGVLVALLDAGLLMATATPFQWLFVISGVGRVVAGTIGGYVAWYGTKPNTPGKNVS